MGVTLERVQNKFACIIGELCSEPVILSQFAIWVDLRIAEYKAKGAISLEISGEDPDPSWLRGHKPSAPPVESRDRTPDMYDPTGGSDSNFNSDLGHAQLVEDRLSPEVVMVKDEPADAEHGEVFPISLRGNSSLVINPHHKRKHSETLPSGSSIHHSSSFLSSSSSPAKMHRSSQSSNVSTPGTQSLMSIISDIPGSSNDNSENQNLDCSRVTDTTQSKGDNFLSSYIVSNPGSHSSHLQGNSSLRIPEGHGTSDNAGSVRRFQNLSATAAETPSTNSLPILPADSYTCDKQFWKLFPHQFESMQLTPDHLVQLTRETKADEGSESSLNLSDEVLTSLLKKSSSPGHLAKNILYQCFTLGELWQRNAHGKCYQSQGRRKGPLNIDKMKELMKIVKLHYQEPGVEKIVTNAVNTGIRHLWRRKLNHSWLHWNL